MLPEVTMISYTRSHCFLLSLNMLCTYTMRNLINFLFALRDEGSESVSLHYQRHQHQHNELNEINVLLSLCPKIILNCVLSVMRRGRGSEDKSNDNHRESEAVFGARASWQPFSSSNMFTQSPFAGVVRMTRNFPFFRMACGGGCMRSPSTRKQLTSNSADN